MRSVRAVVTVKSVRAMVTIKTIQAVVTALVLAGCAGAGPPVEIVEPLQLGDRRLDCPAILAEIARMDAIVQQANGAIQAGESRSQAVGIGSQVAGTAGALGGVPFVGLLPGLLAPGGSNQAAEAKANAMQRKQHLIALHDARNCG